jgi:AraC-like DNA-binding protein
MVQLERAQSHLSRFQLFHTADLEEARARVGQVFCEHRLDVVGGRARVDASMHYKRVGGLGIGLLGYGASVTIDPGRLETFYLVQVLLKGTERVRTMGETVCATPARASIISPSEAVFMHHEQGCDKLFLRIDRNALERQCSAHLGRTLREPLTFAPCMPLDTERSAPWLRLLHWLLAELNAAPGSSCIDSPLLAAQIEQTMMAALLSVQPHQYSASLSDGRHGVAPGFIRRVERYIDENAHLPITVVDMAEHAGISTRSLHQGFRKYRDTTPAQHLAEVRLERVRQELMAGPTRGDTIRDVALRWGFHHHGHFSARYLRRYGELPSQTLSRG